MKYKAAVAIVGMILIGFCCWLFNSPTPLWGLLFILFL